MGNLSLVLLNAPPVLLRTDHPVAKQHHCRVLTPACQCDCLLLFLLQVLLILIAPVGLIHLDSQLSHEVKRLGADGQEPYQPLEVGFQHVAKHGAGLAATLDAGLVPVAPFSIGVAASQRANQSGIVLLFGSPDAVRAVSNR